jgi:hypothetical protein
MVQQEPSFSALKEEEHDWFGSGARRRRKPMLWRSRSPPPSKRGFLWWNDTESSQLTTMRRRAWKPRSTPRSERTRRNANAYTAHGCPTPCRRDQRARRGRWREEKSDRGSIPASLRSQGRSCH